MLDFEGPASDLRLDYKRTLHLEGCSFKERDGWLSFHVDRQLYQTRHLLRGRDRLSSQWNHLPKTILMPCDTDVCMQNATNLAFMAM